MGTFAREIALAVMVGAVAVGLLGAGAAVRRWVFGWGIVVLALDLLSLLLLRADLAADVPWTTVVGSLATGRGLAIQILAIGAALVLVATRARIAHGVALALLLVGAAAPAIGGHAGHAGDHGAAGVAVALHIAGISVWMGGLAVLVALATVDRSAAVVVLPRFSGVALACVLVVGESGLLAASLGAGTLGTLLGSTYGSIVLAKSVAFCWLVRLGWLQRRRVLDRLSEDAALAVSARLAGLELLLMGAGLAGAVVIARIGAPSSPADGFAPLTLAALGIAAPMLIALLRPCRWRVVAAAPEIAVIVLLFVLVEVGGVGLLRTVAGPVGLLVEIALLSVVGWVGLSAILGSVSQGPLVIAMAGFVIAMAAVCWLDPSTSVRMALVAAMAAVVVLAPLWRHSSAEAADRSLASVAG
jgi:putative copper export protein